MTYDVGMTTTRTPLTRERIIEAAVAYADEHGVEELSMRKLGAALGVEAMSLYNHVEGKDDIHDGMIDYVFASIPLPDPDLNWRDAIRQIGTGALEQFSRHPWVVQLLMRRGNFGPSALAFTDATLGFLRRAGFSDDDTQHAWQMLASHTMGYAVQQATAPGAMEEEMAEISARVAQVIDQFPNVAALAPLLAECNFATEYVFGLEIILDGLETRLGS
ncbi:MAG: TetR/AcrR family transcriptional regulator C-terminal domain-containing protein [Acidimicrobiia bacterium]